MAAADAAQKTVAAGTNMLGKAFGFVARNWLKVVGVGGICLMLATGLQAPGTEAGVAALAGKSSIGYSDLFNGMSEGATEGFGKVKEFAGWAGDKVGPTLDA